MKIASWNVNSLKVRLPHLLDWLASQQPDVLCLQETKLEDHNFPRARIEAAGYQVACSGQKTYNGVALLAKAPIEDVSCGNPLFPDEQKRLISGTVDGVRVISAYMPNGQEVGCDKYDYKLRWLDALARWLEGELMSHPQLALCGDYNIAPDDRDVHDPERWKDCILVSGPERTAFQRLLALGLSDSFRRFEQPEKPSHGGITAGSAFKRTKACASTTSCSPILWLNNAAPPASTGRRASWSVPRTTPRSGPRSSGIDPAFHTSLPFPSPSLPL